MKAIVLLHEGFEEMEAVAPIDLLRRAEVDVSQVSMTGELLVRGKNGIVLQTECCFHDLPSDSHFDAVILPGGPGIKQLREHVGICALFQAQHSAGRIIACICAAPLLLLDAGLLPGRHTAHPSTSAELPQAEIADCVWDKTVLTSRGAGTATGFALALVEALTNKATRDRIADSICCS